MRKQRQQLRGQEPESRLDETRARILSAAHKLLTRGGRDAVTTRAVAESAGVQPPVLYRHFSDKDAMLDALAEHGFLAYLAGKDPGTQERDAVDILRSGWDLHIEFGLTHPELYLLMFAHPKPKASSAAGERAFSMLRQHIRRVAAAGRLQRPEEQAASLFHAAAVGVVLVLLQSPAKERDMSISHLARDAALALIAGTARPSKRRPETTAAITLRAALDEQSPFSIGELTLLREWLERLST